MKKLKSKRKKKLITPREPAAPKKQSTDENISSLVGAMLRHSIGGQSRLLEFESEAN